MATEKMKCARKEFAAVCFAWGFAPTLAQAFEVREWTAGTTSSGASIPVITT
jgi:hypothetical protein